MRKSLQGPKPPLLDSGSLIASTDKVVCREGRGMRAADDPEILYIVVPVRICADEAITTLRKQCGSHNRQYEVNPVTPETIHHFSGTP